MKVVIKFTCFLLIVSILFSSCATILSGGKTKIRVRNGTPPNAHVYVDGNYVGTAPCKFKVHKTMKNAQHHIDIKAQGYETQTVTTNRKFSAGFFLLDICTGVLWLVVDFATGNLYKQKPKKIHYNLMPKEPTIVIHQNATATVSDTIPAEKSETGNVNYVTKKDDSNTSSQQNTNNVATPKPAQNATKTEPAITFNVGDEVYYRNFIFWFKSGKVKSTGADDSFLIDNGEGKFVNKKGPAIYKKGFVTDGTSLNVGDSVIYGNNIFGYKNAKVVSIPNSESCIIESPEGKILMRKIGKLQK